MLTGSYTIPLPAGTYTVKLHFAEIFFDAPNKRQFTVVVQGNTLATSLDVFKTAGKNTAYILTSPPTTIAAGGNTPLKVTLNNVLENSMISAIEITPAATPVVPVPVPVPAPVTVPVPNIPIVPAGTALSTIRINSGATTDWVDPATGFTWSADKFSTTGSLYSGCPKTYNGTTLSTIICDHHAFNGAPGSKGTYAIPVVPGTYTVRLIFGEIFFTGPGQRAFKVSVQGTVISQSLDLAATPGPNKEYDLTTTVTVTSLATPITIEFENIVENAMVSGIEIVPKTTSLTSLLRINAGGTTPWTDGQGNVWSADTYSTNGDIWGLPVTTSIDGTDLDVLYCTERYFFGATGAVGGYNIPIAPGTYSVQLMFAELFFGTPKGRVFSVSVQGTTVKQSLDIFAEVGKNKAYVLSAVVNVDAATKAIKINLINEIENAKISAIEILTSSGAGPVAVPVPVPVPAPVTAPVPAGNNVGELRIDAGSNITWTDTATGLAWVPDDAYQVNGYAFNNCPADINGTNQAGLLCTNRVFFSTGGYVIPVPAGTYTVKLMFAELFFGSAKSRVFDILLQGVTAYKGFDIIALAGAKQKSYVVTNTVLVTSAAKGIIIDFVNVVDNAMINAIQITPQGTVPIQTPTILPEFRIDAGNEGTWTDPATGLLWSADTTYQVNGFAINNCPADIAGSNQSGLLCTNRVFFGGGGFVIPVPAGTYTVKLMFAELFFGDPNSRVFDIMIQGATAYKGFDIFALAKGKLKAYDYTTTVTVVSPATSITIDFVNVINYAMVNAIHVIPGTGIAPIASPPSTVVIPVPVPVPVPAPVKAPVPVPVPVPQAPVPVPLAVRINAGSGESWTDPTTGLVWAADNYYSGGNGNNFCPLTIGGTNQGTLYCTERSFEGPFGTSGSYNIPSKPGLYTVNLYFAEIFFEGVSDRVFKVVVQGKIVDPGLDIIAQVGKNNAYVLSTTATVSPVFAVNYLTIEFDNIIQNSKVSAIEVIPYVAPAGAPVAAPVVTFDPLRINCGYDTPYVDSVGRTWQPDQYFIGGMTYSKVVPTIANTADDLLFHYERIGDSFTYNITVPTGKYQVNLYFAETVYTNTKERVFDIQVGTDVFEDYDILSVVPVNTATNLQFFPTVDDGTLSIKFIKSPDYINSASPKVNAIEVLLDAPHVAHAVATGPYFGTDVDGSGKGIISLKGETSHTHGPTFYISEVAWKEGNALLGNTLNLDSSFTVGNHTISLTVKDSGGYENTEVTTVSIRQFGYPAITQLSPNTGNIDGGYDIIIKGSGFNYPVTNMFVVFGQTTITGNDIQIIDSKTLKIVCPSAAFGGAVDVVVKTPLGTSVPSSFKFVGSIPIDWTTGVLFSFLRPTVGRFGPDKKFYLGTNYGRLIKLTMNADFTQVLNALVVKVNDKEETILGIAFDPMDTKDNPDVYFTANWFFHGGTLSSSGSTINGRIRRASGANFETIVDVITGLPVSDLDHGLNAIEFGDNGELYFCSGSHTNGGVPGPLSSSRLLKENFLSAGCNVAYMSHPDFNGNIKWSALDDGNMIASGIDVFGQGLRNPFGLVYHSNGKIYNTDNGPNIGYGRMSTGCATNQDIPDVTNKDEVNLLQKGNYYGHPNKKRAAYFNDPRQCIYYGGEKASVNGYTAPLVVGDSSRTGILEFQGNHFGGQLRGNLIVVQYAATVSFSRLILNDDGSDVVPQSAKFISLYIGTDSLDVAQAPNGNLIDVRYNSDSVAYYKPKEPDTTRLLVKSVFPHRGPSAGGKNLSIYGVNFGTAGNSQVKVGGVDCPISTISPSYIECTLPGGAGAVDVVVTSGDSTSILVKGYRYITGVMPVGFVLPVYKG